MSASTTRNHDPVSESLSALMDGETTELEIRRLLKSDDPEMLAQWHRYQLSSAILRGDITGHVALSRAESMAAGISAAIAAEPALATDGSPTGELPHDKLSVDAEHSTGRSLKTWGPWSYVVRFGVAASVAATLIIGIQLAPTETTSGVASAPAEPARPVATQPSLGADTSVRVVSQSGSATLPQEQRQPIILNEATRQQLEEMKTEANRLMLEHAQNASQHTRQGVLPYVRVPESE